MSSYEIFRGVAGVLAYAAGGAGIALLIERARTGHWSSRSTAFFAALLFFFIPAGVLFRLLSRPFAEQDAEILWLQLGLLLLWFAAGATNTFRLFRVRSKRAEYPIT